MSDVRNDTHCINQERTEGVAHSLFLIQYFSTDTLYYTFHSLYFAISRFSYGLQEII